MTGYWVMHLERSVPSNKEPLFSDNVRTGESEGALLDLTNVRCKYRLTCIMHFHSSWFSNLMHK